ncbi:MAG: TrkH family potassium uptake protein [Chloroflexota bacterium]
MHSCAADAARRLAIRPRERVVRRVIVKPEETVVRVSEPRRLRVREPIWLALSFAGMSFIGSLLLSLPMANNEGTWTPYVVALFTATSAVCVTGLVIVDTGAYWSPFGQVVILALIQIGGLGFMTASTFLFLLFGRRLSLAERVVLRASHGVTTLGDIIVLTRQAVIVTFLIEAVGTLILTVRFARDYQLPQALWYGLFHALSGFNQAGFSPFPGGRSLVPFNQDPVVVFTIATLIILGGLSFTVLLNVAVKRRYRYLLLDTKLVLWATSVLLVVGMVGILLFESANPQTLGPMAWPAKLMNAFFGAVTPRSGGLNTVETGLMTEGGLFLTIVLMFIGSAAGSTGGGIKVNTFAALGAAVLATVRGKQAVAAFGNEIPPIEINRALTVSFLALMLVATVTLLFSTTEQFDLLHLLFESTSAFGTCGLSTGVTPYLSLPAKIVMIGMMLVGRVGPLTVGLALAQRARAEHTKYPPTQLKIG